MTTFRAFLFFTGFTITSLFSCDSIIDEDAKIKKALTGKLYIDSDEYPKSDGVKESYGQYFDDGRFIWNYVIEEYDSFNEETFDVTIKVRGTWKVKDKFIYYKFDINNLKVIPADYAEDIKKNLKTYSQKYNSPEKVLKFDASKIVLEDSDGERYTLKKAY
jgi:hypothetical protein